MKYPDWNDIELCNKLIDDIMNGRRPNMRTLGMTIE
ncbi:hypothetical protein LCGC14_0586440 [marine sediment metagenome]|uniref:Uncharacterized protein n=1 Tax=marine sediment metagenome TaxID=412755 RepID=A0A0F9UN59_9ZZZZ